MIPRSVPSSASLLLGALWMLASGLAAGAAAAQVRLDRPSAKLPDDFGVIQTVRELPDGRVLVADPLGKALYRVDFGTGTRELVGSEGRGPDEYLQPDAVWPLPGDSTLLVDLGNGRLAVLGPDLTFGRTLPLSQGEGIQAGGTLVLAIPQAVDGSGGIYFPSMGSGGPGGQLPDSGSIMRLDGTTGEIATVGRFKSQERKVNRSGGPGNQQVSIEPIPLSPEDAWGVAPDGSVVVARAGDYHVEWAEADGTVVRGGPVDHESVRIGMGEKERYLLERARSGGGIGVTVQVVDGRPTMGFQRGGQVGRPREADQYTWPDRLPPFYGGRILVDGRDRAWVRRQVAAGDDTTYDLFDRTGRRVGTVLLDRDANVVAFGPSGVYVVRYDEFDLNYLERYEMPRL